MQFEEFDKKIREAAENHHPAYDEQAWAKMNKLLDKHMPEKDERRRRFAWLFFLLFLVGGAGIFYGVQSLINTRSEAVASAKSVPVAKEINETVSNAPSELKQVPDRSNSGNGGTTASGSTYQSVNTPTGSTGKGIVIPVAGEVKPLTASGRNQFSGSRQSAAVVNTSGRTKVLQQAVGNRNTVQDLSPVFQSGNAKKKKKQQLAQSVNDQVSEKNVSAEPLLPPGTPETLQGAIKPATGPIAKVADEVKTDPSSLVQVPVKTAADPKTDSANTDVTAAMAPPAKAKSSKKQSHLFVTLSAGPDASFAGNGKPGRIIPVTGAGFGYIYRGRFSLRAGFYNAAKIYTASPDAYNAPPNFYNYYPFLVKVDANCRVYEIPVSLGYHFAARKDHSWFASATLSSYLMKRETYNYSYKTSAWGSLQQREWNLYNRNKHMFSVFGISGGYQHKLTERISFIAEPYFRMPLQGVGYGKVKLNSAGVLFSLAVQPSALVPRKQKK